MTRTIKGIKWCCLLFFFLVLFDLLVAFCFPPKHYCVWPPHLRKVFRPDPDVLVGIEGPARFQTNALGIRGDEFSNDQKYRILTVGGSTTECFYLDQAKTWPALLEADLNRLNQNRVWVGNVGRSGLSSRHHILALKYLLPQYPKIDLVVLLVGANDFLMSACDPNYDPFFQNKRGAVQKLCEAEFSVNPQSRFYKRTVTWQILRWVNLLLSRYHDFQDSRGKNLENWGEEREHATRVVQQAPDLSAALNEYARNLNTLIDLARQSSVRVIFLTQPSLWKANPSKEERRLLWMGKIAKHGESSRVYYSEEALDHGLRQFNQTLLEVCKRRQVDCIDLAGLLPKSTSIFYDDMHFNENGATQVEKIILRYLRNERQPSG